MFLEGRGKAPAMTTSELFILQTCGIEEGIFNFRENKNFRQKKNAFTVKPPFSGQPSA